MTLEEEIEFRRKYAVELMRSSTFLLHNYYKTFKKDDPQRYSVEDTIKGLVAQIRFEWEQQCKTPVFNVPPDFGDKMTMEDWVECVNCTGFIDYDGGGSLATDTQESNISINPSDITFFKVKLPVWATHVIWYNR